MNTEIENWKTQTAFDIQTLIDKQNDMIKFLHERITIAECSLSDPSSKTVRNSFLFSIDKYQTEIVVRTHFVARLTGIKSKINASHGN